MTVKNQRTVPNVLRGFGILLIVGASAEGLLFLGIFDAMSDDALNTAGLLFGAVGLVVLVGLPVVLFRQYGFVSALIVLFVFVLFSVITTLLSLELPGWILVIGLWPLGGGLYFAVSAVEYMLRRVFSSK